MKTWTTTLGKQFDSMAQGDTKTGTHCMDSIFVMIHSKIKSILKDRVITYVPLVVDFRPQEQDRNHIFLMTDGNSIHYPGELTTCTADMKTSEIL